MCVNFSHHNDLKLLSVSLVRDLNIGLSTLILYLKAEKCLSLLPSNNFYFLLTTVYIRLEIMPFDICLICLSHFSVLVVWGFLHKYARLSSFLLRGIFGYAEGAR